MTETTLINVDEELMRDNFILIGYLGTFLLEEGVAESRVAYWLESRARGIISNFRFTYNTFVHINECLERDFHFKIVKLNSREYTRGDLPWQRKIKQQRRY